MAIPDTVDMQEAWLFDFTLLRTTNGTRTMTAAFRDCATYWRSSLLPDAEMLTATYYLQEFSPHWHEGYSIPIIQHGAQTYRYRGGSRLAASGSIAAINPGEVHTGERASDDGWAYRAFYPSAQWLRLLAADIAGADVGYPWFPDDAIADHHVASHLGRAHQLLERGGDMLAAETALVAAFAMLISRHGLSRARTLAIGHDDARVRRMQACLADDLASPLTLSELGKTVGLSAFHAARLFSATVGMPPHAWRNQLRLNRALGLLRQGVAATDAAFATGFTDQSHFTRHFKRAYGTSPGRWKAA